MNKEVFGMDNRNNELAHYGVLGMKWGVRRARKQYTNATNDVKRKKAADRLNKHKQKATKKLDKYYAKGNKQLNKAIRKRYGLFGSNEKYQEAKAKADRIMYKGDKWYKKMEKEFNKQSVASLSENDVKKGRQFAKYFEQNADFTKSMYNV